MSAIDVDDAEEWSQYWKLVGTLSNKAYFHVKMEGSVNAGIVGIPVIGSAVFQTFVW